MPHTTSKIDGKPNIVGHHLLKRLLPGSATMSKPRMISSPQTGTKSATRTKPKPPEAKELPPYKVLLHNDDVNDMLYVVRTIMELTHLNKSDSTLRMMEAHTTGVALLLV